MGATTMRHRLTAAGIACVSITIVACGGGGSGGGGSTVGPPAAREALTQFDDCDELRAALVDDARQKIALEADDLRTYAFSPPFEGPIPTATPGGAMATPAPGGEPGAGPANPTDTNVQVPGVDEADTVETVPDGSRLYVLRPDELLVFDTAPPAATALRTRAPIEGFTIGMFVAGSRALVLSSVSPDFGGGDPCHIIAPPVAELFAPEPPTVPCGTPAVKATLLDVGADPPRVVRELYLEGEYTAARRHGTIARIIVRRWWSYPASVPSPWDFIGADGGFPTTRETHVARVDAWESAALAAVDATSVPDWLPAGGERTSAGFAPLPIDCRDVHVPPPAVASDGTLRVVAFDMATDDGPLADDVIVGDAQTVYANADTLLVAQPTWSARATDAAHDATAVHVFALEPGSVATTYQASGLVDGVPLSQFAFDVHDGVIRVATTITSFDDAGTVNRLTTWRVEDDGLVQVGTTPDLAPGERIFAARYLGSKAYLVTFRQIDPLFVIDLADPSRPTVLGSVELPGFSEYLHPLDEAHLLTIGTDFGPFGFERVPTLRIFDVGDPTAPRLAHVERLPVGSTPAQSNHLAFIFDARLGLLALPFTRFEETPRAAMLVIGVDAAAGFDPRGEIDDFPLRDPVCRAPGACFSSAAFDRGVFIGDALYSVHSSGVLVNATADLAPLAAVAVAQPLEPGPVPTPGQPTTPIHTDPTLPPSTAVP